MFILGNLVITISQVLNMILTVLYWLVLIRALASWLNPDPYNPIVQILHQTTEPILEPIRRLMPPTPLDFSPIVAFLLIYAVRSFVVASLFDLGLRLKY